MSKIELMDGKYMVINELEEGGGFRALRYGEEWRNLVGDNLVLAMAYEIEELREKLAETEVMLSNAFDGIDELEYEDLHVEVFEFLYGGDDE